MPDGGRAAPPPDQNQPDKPEQDETGNTNSPDTTWGYDVPYAGVDFGDDEYASKMRANLVRAQWEDYKARFRPIEDELVASLDKPANTGRAVSAASRSFDRASESDAMRLSRYGVSRNARQSRAFERRTGLAEAASKAGAASQARERKYKRDLELMAGGSATVSGARGES